MDKCIKEMTSRCKSLDLPRGLTSLAHSLTLRFLTTTVWQDGVDFPSLLLRWEANNGPESPFGHDGRSQRIANGDKIIQDLWSKPEKSQQLRHPCTRYPQFAR